MMKNALSLIVNFISKTHKMFTLSILLLFKVMSFGTVDTAANCFERVADIVFVLDSSTSIRTSEFEQQKHFVNNVVDNFEIGANNIQIGVIVHSSQVHSSIHLNQYKEKAPLKEAISRINYIHGGTATEAAIRHARKNMFTIANGHRLWAAKIIILLTDGYFDLEQYKEIQQEASFARHNNITIIAIGVGDAFTRDKEIKEIEHIVSTPSSKHRFLVDDYGALDRIKQSLSIRACSDIIGVKEETNILEERKEPQTFCSGKSSDTYFLLDSSTSISREEFQELLQFVIDAIEMLDISDTNTRVGVYTFSDDITLEIPLLANKKELKRRVSNIRQIYGDTHTGKAIQHIRERGFQPEVARTEVEHIIIVVTDGRSQVFSKTTTEAKLAHEEGIHIFAIGVGDEYNENELNAIANSNVFTVDNYENLSSIINLLAVKTCREMQNDMAAIIRTDCENAGPMDVMFAYDGHSMGIQQINNIISGIIKTSKHFEGIDNIRAAVLSESGSKHSLSKSVFETISDVNVFELKFKIKPQHNIKKLLKKSCFLLRKSEKGRARKIIVLLIDSDLHLSKSVEREIFRTSGCELHTIVVGNTGNFEETIFIDHIKRHYLHQLSSYAHFSTFGSKLAEHICLPQNRK